MLLQRGRIESVYAQSKYGKTHHFEFLREDFEMVNDVFLKMENVFSPKDGAGTYNSVLGQAVRAAPPVTYRASRSAVSGVLQKPGDGTFEIPANAVVFPCSNKFSDWGGGVRTYSRSTKS